MNCTKPSTKPLCWRFSWTFILNGIKAPDNRLLTLLQHCCTIASLYDSFPTAIPSYLHSRTTTTTYITISILSITPYCILTKQKTKLNLLTRSFLTRTLQSTWYVTSAVSTIVLASLCLERVTHRRITQRWRGFYFQMDIVYWKRGGIA
jgi:hypothetical protein